MIQSKSKIIPRIVGGLGNQLFIYAAARRLALVNEAELVIDDISGFKFDNAYQRCYQLDKFSIACRKATAVELLNPMARLRRAFKRKWNQCLPFEQRRYLVQEGDDYDRRLLEYKPRGTVYLEGYWQSENYFKDVESIIRKDLRIKKPNDIANQEIGDYIRKRPSIALHVRFFDEPHTIGNNNVTGDYYSRAVKEMDRLIPSAHYFLFSDQPKSALARIPVASNRVTEVYHNQGDKCAYADLWLMTQCQHHIIANSTFSWWGAWLAAHPSQIVIAPGFNVTAKKRLTAWGFEGLLPEEGIKL